MSLLMDDQCSKTVKGVSMSWSRCPPMRRDIQAQSLGIILLACRLGTSQAFHASKMPHRNSDAQWISIGKKGHLSFGWLTEPFPKQKREGKTGAPGQLGTHFPPAKKKGGVGTGTPGHRRLSYWLKVNQSSRVLTANAQAQTGVPYSEDGCSWIGESSSF